MQDTPCSNPHLIVVESSSIVNYDIAFMAGDEIRRDEMKPDTALALLNHAIIVALIDVGQFNGALGGLSVCTYPGGSGGDANVVLPQLAP